MSKRRLERFRLASLRIAGYCSSRTLLRALLCFSVSSNVEAQAPDALRAEEVTYWSEDGSVALNASLVLPDGAGPHRGVVVLSVAGTTPLVNRLVDDGYAVLLPTRRGFVEVEPLLRATYADLAGDVRAALGYLGSRQEVDPEALAVIAQADDTPPAMMAAVSSAGAPPLVLMAPPIFQGVETFRLEQRGQAERAGAPEDELEALDEFVRRMGEIVLAEETPYMRRYRLESLRAGSPVQLPHNAAFPSDERQMHFFASPLWRDRLAFDPEMVLAEVHAPTLVLIGTEDVNIPLDVYLLAIDRSLSASGNTDVGLCLLPGRTRHAFTEAGVAAIGEWLARHMAAPSRPTDSRGWGPPSACLVDEGR